MGKIPEQATRVFKGVVFDVYQWEQEMFDGSFKTFEMIDRPDTVEVIPVTSEGKLIIAKEQQPGGDAKVGLIGGRVDEGEHPENAIKRELREESGYSAEEYTLWYKITPFEKIRWDIYVYIARGLTKESEQQLESGERIDLMYVTFDDFINKYVMDDTFRDVECKLEVLKAKSNPREYKNLKTLFNPN